MNELQTTAELNLTSWMHQVLMKSKLYKKEVHAITEEDPTFTVDVQVMATTNFKIKKTQPAQKPNKQMNFTTTKQATKCVQWEHCHSKCPNQ